MGNLYETLGVARHASAQDIKRAYRRLAHLYHPDKNPDHHAADAARFTAISRAYCILSDVRKRRRYDRFGPAAVGLEPEQTFHAADFAQNLGATVGDLLHEIFGRKNTSHRRRTTAAQEAQPDSQSTCDLEVDLATAVLGGPVTLQVARPQRCTACVGTGAKPGTVPQLCKQCGGAGALRVQQGVFSVGKRCPSCAGQGRFTAHPCEACQGEGMCRRDTALRIHIPPGVHSGTVLRLRGEAGLRKMGSAADLWVRITVRDHALFRREGADLVCHIPITIVQAALGGQAEIPLLDGSLSHLYIPPGTQNGQVLTLAGQGAMHLGRKSRGNLHVTIEVEVPANLNAAARAHLEALRHLDGAAVHYPRCAAIGNSFITLNP